MKIDYNKLFIDPFEAGRFSMYYDGDTCLGIADHFLNNVYSEDDFKEQVGTLYYLDEWCDVADEMNIDVEDVPVYDAQGNLTDKTYSDYVDGEGEGEWIDHETVEHYTRYTE